MSEQVPGTDNWRVNITSPAKLDPANGTEIKTGLEHLADRTFYLAKLHPRAEDNAQGDDPGYGPLQVINVFVFTNVTALALSLPNTLAGDIIEVTSMANYDTVTAALLEIQHTSDLDGAIIGRRRLPVGSSLSFIHTSYFTVVNPGTVAINTQLRIDAGTITVAYPYSTFAKLFRKTT